MRFRIHSDLHFMLLLNVRPYERPISNGADADILVLAGPLPLPLSTSAAFSNLAV